MTKAKDWAHRRALLLVPMRGDHGEYRAQVDAIDRALRAAYKRGAKEALATAKVFASAEYMRGRSEGYEQGHEDQMRMRIRDAREERKRGTR